MLEALRARRRRLDRLLIRRGRGRDLDHLIAAAESAGVPVEEVDGEALGGSERDSNPQGVVLEAGPLPELDLEELVNGAEKPRRLLALDGVEDPQNVGAITRVAEAAGAHGLILTDRRAPPLTPALARASAGAIEWLPTARVTNLSRALKDLNSKGFWSIGADPEGATGLYALDDRWISSDLVVVLGAEGRGLRPGIAKDIDLIVSIPTPGRVASLNVATAGAVVLFELLRRGDTPLAR